MEARWSGWVQPAPEVTPRAHGRAQAAVPVTTGARRVRSAGAGTSARSRRTRADRDPEGDVSTGNLAGGRAARRPGGGAGLPPRVGGRVPAQFPGDAQGRGPRRSPAPRGLPSAPERERERRGMEAGAADALLSGLCVAFTLGMFSTGL